jgi:hypothetical protein
VKTLRVMFVVAGLLVSFALAPPASRATFAVSPSVIDVARAPGGVASGTFAVRLDGERGQRFRLDVEDLTQAGDGGFRYRPASGSPYSASSWATVSPRRFRGRPDRIQLVEYQVRIPSGAEPGDHVTSLTLKRLGPPSRSQVSTVAALSARVTVRVSGEARQAVAIGEIARPRLASGGPLTVATTVRNTGNVRLDFNRANRGALAVHEGTHSVARLPFVGLLYPGQTRSFRLAVQDPPTIGRLKARASVRLASGTATRSAGFLVLPWRQAAALALIALAAAVAVAQWRRRRKLRPGGAFVEGP